MSLTTPRYNTLMYGGRSISQQASPFHEETPAAAFVSSQFSDMFFKNKDCLRWEQDTCLKPGHRFYEVSRSGLDAMMRRTITEMSLLTYDAPQDMVYTSPRYDYMFTVGRCCGPSAHTNISNAVCENGKLTKLRLALRPCASLAPNSTGAVCPAVDGLQGPGTCMKACKMQLTRL